MIRDDVKKILCDGKAAAMAAVGETIRCDPGFRELPEEIRVEFLKRCIEADEAYITATEDAVTWLMSTRS